MSIQFFLTSLVVIAMPGTGALFTMAAGFSRGARASVVAAAGCTLGIIPHMVAAITGLAALFQASAMAFRILKYLGVAYLLYMAWATHRDRGALQVGEDLAQEEGAAPHSAARVIVSAILVNFLNPKLMIFFFAFLPQFVSTNEPNAFLHMAELSAVFMLLTFVVFVGYGKFAAAIRNHVISRPGVLTWIRRVFAGSFVALAARLAFSGR